MSLVVSGGHVLAFRTDFDVLPVSPRWIGNLEQFLVPTPFFSFPIPTMLQLQRAQGLLVIIGYAGNRLTDWDLGSLPKDPPRVSESDQGLYASGCFGLGTLPPSPAEINIMNIAHLEA
jgi:hypothetical protein